MAQSACGSRYRYETGKVSSACFLVVVTTVLSINHFFVFRWRWFRWRLSIGQQ
ncbi:MAG: hypothetical protein J7J85_04910 [Deltaproteobacteria bacterium]|nr:hypothetical protein [Deltaproteobacteria bacterium]